MTYKYNFLEWEVTTACNAACPQCPRNYYGGKTWENLPIIQNNLNWAQDHLPESFIQNLNRIDFCGTYGDPVLNNSLVEIINWLLSVNSDLKITIKTNGGLRNDEWWGQLAQVLGPNGSVFFGIDGLEDTNHLYRRKVNFNQVMQNAQTFINAGGNAFWNFIVFKHNQHQVDQAQQLSERLGFKGFHSKLTSRFFNKKHELQESLVVFDDNGEPEYTIEIPDDPRYINESYKKIEIIKQISGSLDNFFKNSTIICKCKNWSRIYLSAEGYVFPCGWLHDRMYGFEAEQHADIMQLKNLFELAGGSKFANINYTSIENIVNGPWFETLMNSWSNSIRLNRCEVMCGEQLNLIGDQNKMVKTF
jgi:MoaA/NifB/PqqE/SkfB family radical SAM enzyme